MQMRSGLFTALQLPLAAVAGESTLYLIPWGGFMDYSQFHSREGLIKICTFSGDNDDKL